jgi:proteasome endopeptidase complex, beta component (EC 3.4.25.1). Threonine peptidase. MEROPS family T01A
LAYLKDGYRDDITLNDAVKLAIRAVKAAMLHDPGSGEGVDVITVTKESGYSEVQV